METAEILESINLIARDVFDNEAVVLTEASTAKDVEEWDSLTHIQLIVAVEKKFAVRFTAGEINGFKKVGDICSLIRTKKGA